MTVVTSRLGSEWGLVLTPWVKRLVIATAVASIAAGIARSWYGLPVESWLGLTPAALWGGSEALPGVPALWQPFTYALLALDPFSLVFAALAYGWFAGDLERAWGARLFIDRWLLLVLGVAMASVLGAVLLPELRQVTVLGPSAVLEGIVVAWGLTFPDRRVRIFFFFPINGRALVWITVALTVLPVVFFGRGAMVWALPAIAGVALGLAMGKTKLSLRWIGLHLKKVRLERALRRQRRGGSSWRH